MYSYKMNFAIPFQVNARNANMLSHKLSNLDSHIFISKEGCYRKCNAKSELGLLSLNIGEADHILLQINGQNCISDASAIQKIFNILPS
ncbi:MAG: HPr family phosphocarrier protein [Acutalibacteraceae bacterium]|nr:HPr family phosphocarrier protein [Clostridiales bacterium]